MKLRPPTAEQANPEASQFWFQRLFLTSILARYVISARHTASSLMRVPGTSSPSVGGGVRGWEMTLEMMTSLAQWWQWEGRARRVAKNNAQCFNLCVLLHVRPKENHPAGVCVCVGGGGGRGKPRLPVCFWSLSEGRWNETPPLGQKALFHCEAH